jgi:hypothetical protein
MSDWYVVIREIATDNVERKVGPYPETIARRVALTMRQQINTDEYKVGAESEDVGSDDHCT